jgi:PAS domain S-box-containing protein
MNDEDKRNKQLIDEMKSLRQRVAESEKNKAERKMVEEALRESQRQLADIIDFLPDAIFVIDKKGKVIAWNRAIGDMTGISTEEMIGKNDFEYALPFYGKRMPVLANLVIDPQTIIENRYSSFDREKDILKGEMVVPCLKGKERILSSRAAPIYNNKGEIVGAIESLRDITEHKLMEKALSSEHQNLSSILDGSPVSSFVIDRERRVIAWNMVNEFFTGISKEAVLGKPLDLSPLFKGKIQPTLAVLVLELTDEEIIRRYAHKGIRKSEIHPEAFESTGSIWIKGKEHIMAIQATRLRDAAGNVIGAIQCAEDITEQRRAEEALRESEELYRTALESSNDGVAIVQDGRYVYLNQKLLDTLGRSRDEMMAKAMGATMPPDDRVTVLDYYDKYLRGLPTPDHFEVRVSKPDGAIIYAEVSPVEVTYKGKKSLLAYFRNITDRKRAEEALRQSEQKYRDVFNATSDALFIHNATANILDVNERTCAMFECDRASALGLSLNDISLGVSPYSEVEASEKIRRSIEEGPQVFEWQCRRSSGQVFPCEVALRAYGIDGEMRVVAAVRDITERMRAEEERRQWEQRLQQAQKMESLARMAGAIAHHFNNLLGAVMGNLDLALNNVPHDWRARRNITQAMTASQRAAEISRLMLTYLGHTVQRKEPCNVVEAVREALLLLGPSMPQRVHVKAELPPEAIMIQGDKVHIEQALTNLIVNAREAIGDGDGEITVAVHVMTADKLQEFRLFPSGWQPAENSYVSIAISDTGSGFDPATRERIFDPFFSTKFTGRGLGLAVVLGIVRAHGGALAVESQPGLGSIFRAFLPLPSQQTLHPSQEPTVDFEPFKEGGSQLL